MTELVGFAKPPISIKGKAQLIMKPPFHAIKKKLVFHPAKDDNKRWEALSESSIRNRIYMDDLRSVEIKPTATHHSAGAKGKRTVFIP